MLYLLLISLFKTFLINAGEYLYLPWLMRIVLKNNIFQLCVGFEGGCISLFWTFSLKPFSWYSVFNLLLIFCFKPSHYILTFSFYFEFSTLCFILFSTFFLHSVFNLLFILCFKPSPYILFSTFFLYSVFDLLLIFCF